MSKVLKNSDLTERPAIRTLLAFSLCASIAAFGCTTDRTLGNGDPVVTPGLRTSPTGGAATGTETEATPPPMMSSYSGAQALPTVRPRVARVSREEAALILAELQPRVRVLGPVAPGNGSHGYASDPQQIANAQRVGQRSTINSTIYSSPAEAIISGAGEGIGGGADASATFLDTVGVDATGGVAGTAVAGTSAVAGSTVTNGATALNAGTTVTDAGGAVIAPTTAATATPTGTAIATPSALASVRTLSPTASAVVNPPASISSSPALATVSSSRTAGTAARNTTVTAATANAQTATTTAATQSATVGVASPVRVVTTNGRVTVTNATATTGANSSRQQ